MPAQRSPLYCSFLPYSRATAKVLTHVGFSPGTDPFACHSERSEESLVAHRFFATLRMTGFENRILVTNRPLPATRVAPTLYSILFPHQRLYRRLKPFFLTIPPLCNLLQTGLQS